MICLSIFAFAFASASDPFKSTKARVPGKMYKRRCEDEDSDLMEENNLKDVIKYMRKKNMHESWIGSVVGINFKGTTVLKIYFD